MECSHLILRENIVYSGLFWFSVFAILRQRQTAVILFGRRASVSVLMKISKKPEQLSIQYYLHYLGTWLINIELKLRIIRS